MEKVLVKYNTQHK